MLFKPWPLYVRRKMLSKLVTYNLIIIIIIIIKIDFTFFLPVLPF